MTVSTRHTKVKSEKFQKNILKRGEVPKGSVSADLLWFVLPHNLWFIRPYCKIPSAYTFIILIC